MSVVLWRLADRRAGLVLVTGPTRSGKSTTVGAMLDHINKTRACHILTIEDPIEFVHEPLRAQITHREIGQHASSFPVALRSAGRENPDVVLVSELRLVRRRRSSPSSSRARASRLRHRVDERRRRHDRPIIITSPTPSKAQVRGYSRRASPRSIAAALRTADARVPWRCQRDLIGSAAVSGMVREAKTAQLRNVMQAGRPRGMQTMDMGLERSSRQSRISARGRARTAPSTASSSPR